MVIGYLPSPLWAPGEKTTWESMPDLPVRRSVLSDRRIAEFSMTSGCSARAGFMPAP
jgi:hypothetical protein